MNILVIRRNDIGDLVVTTPLIQALCRRFPEAWSGALVNSYNARVLEANPDLDEVFVYTKAKHRGSASVWSAYWSTFSLILRLRKLRVDYATLASAAASSKDQMFARRIKFHRSGNEVTRSSVRVLFEAIAFATPAHSCPGPGFPTRSRGPKLYRQKSGGSITGAASLRMRTCGAEPIAQREASARRSRSCPPAGR